MWYRQRGRWQEFRNLTEAHPLAMSFAGVAEALAPTYPRKGIAPGTTQRIRDAIGRFVIIPYGEEVTGSLTSTRRFSLQCLPVDFAASHRGAVRGGFVHGGEQVGAEDAVGEPALHHQAERVAAADAEHGQAGRAGPQHPRRPDVAHGGHARQDVEIAEAEDADG